VPSCSDAARQLRRERPAVRRGLNCKLAQTARPATVRSLDAIHLGTALHARQALTSFVTYDKRLLDAVTAAGLRADSPV
jgi:predicted nucleic acid-binding protein